MAKTIRAKFRCHHIEEQKYEGGEKYAEKVHMSAVTSSGPNDPNQVWATATPQGTFHITIGVKELFGTYQVGKSYYLDSSEAPEEGGEDGQKKS